MAVVDIGVSACPLCGALLREDDELVATSHFISDPFHPLASFSDAAMHKSCFLEWEHRAEFVRLFNEIMSSGQFGPETREQMQEDGSIVNFPSEMSIPVRLIAEPYYAGWTALHSAAKWGEYDKALQLLTQNPALIHIAGAHGSIPLHVAAIYGETELVHLMLDAGADPQARTSDGETPLHWAGLADGGNWGEYAEIVKMLLDAGAEVNAQTARFVTPLHWASEYNTPDVVSLLLLSGAAVNARDFHGGTPLHYAACGNNEQVIHVLLNAGADKDLINAERCTPLHKAAAAMGDTRRIIEALLDAGADINAYDAEGRMALHLTASNGAMTLTRLLLARGSQITFQDRNGRTPRDLALEKGNTMIVRIIDHELNKPHNFYSAVNAETVSL